MKDKINKLKKIKSSPLSDESFSSKEYLKEMSVPDARLNFKMRTHMFDVKYNYSHDPIYSRELWRCDSCETCIETQSHILWCPSYSELRKDKDLNNDKDLIGYLKGVISVREKLNLNK